MQKVRINSPKSELIHKILETVEKAIALHRTHMHKTTHTKYKMHLNNLLHQKRVRINTEVEGMKKTTLIFTVLEAGFTTGYLADLRTSQTSPSQHLFYR